MHSFNLSQTLTHLNLDVPSFRPVARAYIQDVTEFVAGVTRAAERLDFPAIAESARALKRVASVIRADELARLADQLEASAQTEDTESTAQVLGQLHHENRDVTAVLRTVAGYE